MHSKVIVASLICMLAATFGDVKAIKAFNKAQPKADEICCSNSPNEHHANAEIVEDRGVIAAGGWFDIITDILVNGSASTTITSRNDPNSLLEGYYSKNGRLGVTINIPSNNGDYYIAFSINGNEVVKVYIFVKNGAASVSFLSKFDARGKYFMQYVASEDEKEFFPEAPVPPISGGGDGPIHTNSYGLAHGLGSGVHLNGFRDGLEIINPPFINQSEDTRFTAYKHYNEFVYDGTNDIVVERETTAWKKRETRRGTDIIIHAKWYDDDGYDYPLQNARLDIMNDEVSIMNEPPYYDITVYPRTDNNGDYQLHLSESEVANLNLGLVDIELMADTGATYVQDGNYIKHSLFYGNVSNNMMFVADLANYKKVEYTINIYPTRSDRAAAFEITQAELVCRNFASGSGPAIQTKYPAQKTEYTRGLNGQDPFISIRQGQFRNWDVINHEFCHHICELNNLCLLPYTNQAHLINEDLFYKYGKCDGYRLAFSEGLATYLAIKANYRAVEYWESNYTSDLNNFVYDNMLDDMKYTDPINGVDIDFENYAQNSNMCGDGIEASVTSMLLKLDEFFQNKYEQSVLPVTGFVTMWNLLDDSGTWYMGSFLQKVANTYPQFKAEIGQLIQEERYMDGELYCENYNLQITSDINSDCWYYSWPTASGVSNYPNRFELVFVGADGDTFVKTGITNYYTTLQRDEAVAVLNLSGNYCDVYVVGYNTYETTTMTYFSAPLRMEKPNMYSISEGETLNGNLEYGERDWFKFVAPHAGNFTFTARGLVDTYGELFSSIVLDDIYYGYIGRNDDDGASDNFLIEAHLEAGQVVYLRVRGCSDEDTGNYSVTVYHIHSFGPAVPYDSYYHKVECECGYYELQMHIFDTTYTRNGHEYGRCAICGAVVDITNTPHPGIVH